MSFYERYEKCCIQKGIQPKSQFAANMLGCTKASISAFSKTGKAPNGNIIANAAKMLDVSSDYLLNITDIQKPIKTNYTQKELDILTDLQGLNEDAQNSAHAMILGLLNIKKYKKD